MDDTFEFRILKTKKHEIKAILAEEGIILSDFLRDKIDEKIVENKKEQVSGK